MSYTPTNWQARDKVTATKLNKIEQGIVDGSFPEYTASDEGKVLTVIMSSGNPVLVWEDVADSASGVSF